jgi:Reverse transcriptase (RNA-dependent DNA polymerase)
MYLALLAHSPGFSARAGS